MTSSDVDPAHSKSIYESEVTSAPSEDKTEEEDDEDIFDEMWSLFVIVICFSIAQLIVHLRVLKLRVSAYF